MGMGLSLVQNCCLSLSRIVIWCLHAGCEQQTVKLVTQVTEMVSKTLATIRVLHGFYEAFRHARAHGGSTEHAQSENDLGEDGFVILIHHFTVNVQALRNLAPARCSGVKSTWVRMYSFEDRAITISSA